MLFVLSEYYLKLSTLQVWEGVTKKRNFGEVRCISATLDKQAREILEKHEVEHYWDLAYSTSLLKDD